MKPLHIGLLVLGAALAGGLAVRMTKPPAIPVETAPLSPAVVPLPAPVVRPAVAVAPAPLQAPDAFAARPAKPSPIPKPVPPPVADAPAPVYANASKPVVRPAKAVLLAKALPQKAAPTQWTPTPYQTPTTPVAAKPEPLPETTPEPTPAPVPAPEPRHVTLRTGMTVSVRLEESLSSDRATPGDTFQASLAEPLVVDSLVIAERGARATGRIVEAQRGARLGNPSEIELALTSVLTSDGQRIALTSDPWVKLAERGDDPIGAIFGRPKPANVPTAAIIRFRLSSRVTVTEQIAAR